MLFERDELDALTTEWFRTSEGSVDEVLAQHSQMLQRVFENAVIWADSASAYGDELSALMSGSGAVEAARLREQADAARAEAHAARQVARDAVIIAEKMWNRTFELAGAEAYPLSPSLAMFVHRVARRDDSRPVLDGMRSAGDAVRRFFLAEMSAVQANGGRAEGYDKPKADRSTVSLFGDGRDTHALRQLKPHSPHTQLLDHATAGRSKDAATITDRKYPTGPLFLKALSIRFDLMGDLVTKLEGSAARVGGRKTSPAGEAVRSRAAGRGVEASSLPALRQGLIEVMRTAVIINRHSAYVRAGEHARETFADFAALPAGSEGFIGRALVATVTGVTRDDVDVVLDTANALESVRLNAKLPDAVSKFTLSLRALRDEVTHQLRVAGVDLPATGSPSALLEEGGVLGARSQTSREQRRRITHMPAGTPLTQIFRAPGTVEALSAIAAIVSPDQPRAASLGQLRALPTRELIVRIEDPVVRDVALRLVHRAGGPFRTPSIAMPLDVLIELEGLGISQDAPLRWALTNGPQEWRRSPDEVDAMLEALRPLCAVDGPLRVRDALVLDDAFVRSVHLDEHGRNVIDSLRASTGLPLLDQSVASVVGLPGDRRFLEDIAARADIAIAPESMARLNAVLAENRFLGATVEDLRDWSLPELLHEAGASIDEATAIIKLVRESGGPFQRPRAEAAGIDFDHIASLGIELDWTLADALSALENEHGMTRRQQKSVEYAFLGLVPSNSPVMLMDFLSLAMYEINATASLGAFERRGIRALQAVLGIRPQLAALRSIDPLAASAKYDARRNSSITAYVTSLVFEERGGDVGERMSRVLLTAGFEPTVAALQHWSIGEMFRAGTFGPADLALLAHVFRSSGVSFSHPRAFPDHLKVVDIEGAPLDLDQPFDEFLFASALKPAVQEETFNFLQAFVLPGVTPTVRDFIGLSHRELKLCAGEINARRAQLQALYRSITGVDPHNRAVRERDAGRNDGNPDLGPAAGPAPTGPDLTTPSGPGDAATPDVEVEAGAAQSSGDADAVGTVASSPDASRITEAHMLVEALSLRLDVLDAAIISGVVLNGGDAGRARRLLTAEPSAVPAAAESPESLLGPVVQRVDRVTAAVHELGAAVSRAVVERSTTDEHLQDALAVLDPVARSIADVAGRPPTVVRPVPEPSVAEARSAFAGKALEAATEQAAELDERVAAVTSVADTSAHDEVVDRAVAALGADDAITQMVGVARSGGVFEPTSPTSMLAHRATVSAKPEPVARARELIDRPQAPKSPAARAEDGLRSAEVAVAVGRPEVAVVTAAEVRRNVDQLQPAHFPAVENARLESSVRVASNADAPGRASFGDLVDRARTTAALNRRTGTPDAHRPATTAITTTAGAPTGSARPAALAGASDTGTPRPSAVAASPARSTAVSPHRLPSLAPSSR